jgi:glycosyltransferase involved in cell wall biosynthesis
MHDKSELQKLSIVIPVYNEETTVEEIVDRVFAVDYGNVVIEVIICDDGSSDNSFEVIQQLKRKYPGIISYHSPVNLGKGAAVRIGISISSGEIITIQDADLELDPKDYPRLLSPILAHQTDIIYGSRFLNQNIKLNPVSRGANRALTFLTNFLYRAHLTDMETAYKMFRREVITNIRLRCVHFDFEPEITAQFLKKGHKIIELPITYQPRTVQKGKKISWIDGFEAIFTLIRCRFFD